MGVHAALAVTCVVPVAPITTRLLSPPVLFALSKLTSCRAVLSIHRYATTACYNSIFIDPHQRFSLPLAFFVCSCSSGPTSVLEFGADVTVDVTFHFATWFDEADGATKYWVSP